MSTDASISIANFADHFECELEKIDTLRVWFRGEIDHSASSRLYQRTLYSTVLDTLSRAAFPDAHGHRQRMLSFIDIYTGWAHRSRISLPQLYLCLKTTAKSKGVLHMEVAKQLSGWPEGAVIRPDKDPDRVDMVHLAATPAERKAIEAARYAALFYTYRNHLVHEFREPGYGIEHEDDVWPFPRSLPKWPASTYKRPYRR